MSTDKKIKIGNTILDTDEQKKLADIVESFMYTLQRVEVEKLTQNDILERAKNELKINKQYVRNAARELFAEEQGKLNTNEKEQLEAAVVQVKEIYTDKKLNNFASPSVGVQKQSSEVNPEDLITE